MEEELWPPQVHRIVVWAEAPREFHASLHYSLVGSLQVLVGRRSLFLHHRTPQMGLSYTSHKTPAQVPSISSEGEVWVEVAGPEVTHLILL